MFPNNGFAHSQAASNTHQPVLGPNQNTLPHIAEAAEAVRQSLAAADYYLDIHIQAGYKVSISTWNEGRATINFQLNKQMEDPTYSRASVVTISKQHVLTENL